MRLKRDEAGFTLLEIMIALAIVGGLLVTLIYTLNYHLDIAGRQETLTVASMLAKNKLLEMETANLAEQGEFPEPFNDFHYKTSISDTAFPGIRKISVVVSKGGEAVTFMELTGNPR